MTPQLPSEHLAQQEKHRADGLARRCGEISGAPGHPSAGSLHHYQAAYRNASGTAAAHTTQPDVGEAS